MPYNEYWTTEDVSVVLSDGTSVEVTKTEENTFTFVQPEGVVTISATFGPKSTETYSIRVIQPEEGATITLVQTEPQMAGTEITFNVQVENGFELYYCDIMDENGEMLSYYENLNEEYRAYSFIMPDSDVTISIHVEVLKYWIWGSVYGDGEWNEGGSLVVMPERPRLGETVSVIVAPERGYKLESLVLYYWDNEIWEMVEITPVQVNENYYTFTQPNEDVNIEAYFVSAAVNVKQPSNGTITVEPESPAVDDIVIITVAPDAGYVADSVTVKDRDGNEVETEKVKDGIYTYKQPEGQVTISATMVEKEYQILVDEVVNGKVSVSHELAKAGTKVTVNVTPDDGYKLTSVSAVNAKGEALTLVEEDGVYTFTQPKSNVTVAAVFEKADASAVLLGDITLDGTVDMADLVMMLRVIVKRVSVEDLTSEQILAGDVIDGDGEITMADLVKMLRYIVKRIPSLE